MENSSVCGTSGSKGKISEAIRDSVVTSLGQHNSVDELVSSVSGKVKINDGNRTNNLNDVPKHSVDWYYFEEEEEEEEDGFSEEELLAQMGYGKSEPRKDIVKDPQRQYYDEEEEDDGLSEEAILVQMGYLKNEPPKHEPITTPTANLNLVSAFKGSREKEGKLTRQSRVSWAPDIYDPPPTSDDHFAQSTTERHKSEQKAPAGKNRQLSGGKWLEATEDGGSGDKGSKGPKGGGSKESVGGEKAVGKGKDKKPADKKQGKKHNRGASKYSNFGEC